MQASINVANTLFIVSSKSGGTTEPNVMKDYFFARVSEAIGAEKAGHRFIAVTDPGSPWKMRRKALLGRDLLQRRSGIGHRDEALAGLLGADRLGDAGEEIILHDVRLGGAAGLAGDDEQRVGDVDRSLHGADLRGIGRIQHVQFRETGLACKGLRQHFRPQARSAHPEHHGVG